MVALADKLSAEELAADIGFSKAFFYSDAELKRLLQRALRAQWTPQRFQAEFMKTKWYRGRAASIRTWADLKVRDPAEAKAKIAARRAEMQDMLTQLGLNVSSKTLAQMAENSLKFAWSNSQVKDVLANMVTYNPGKMSGTPATLEMQFKQLANDYGIQASDRQIGDWINGMLGERYTEDNIRDFLRDSAKSKYAGMATWLDKGMTVREAASNHLSSFSRLMEVDANTVDMMDPLIQQALQGKPDPKTGVPLMETVYEFERSIKKDSRWLKTKNARDDMTNAAMGIARDWGLVA
jgi:hypothetical protein